ncbi:MAG: hypothetical protein AB7I19_05225 [Planctomycetota bacterium]
MRATTAIGRDRLRAVVHSEAGSLPIGVHKETEGRARHAAGRLGLLRVAIAIVFAATSLCLGCGQIGERLLDLATRRDSARADQVVGEALRMLAACRLDEVPTLNARAIPASDFGGARDWSLDFAVSELPSGYRVTARLMGPDSANLLREFVAWRARA